MNTMGRLFFPGAAQFLGEERDKPLASLALGRVVEPSCEFCDPAPPGLT